MSIVITEADRQSPAYMKMMAHLDDRMAELTQKLTGDMSEEDTWKFRGRIAEIRALISIDEVPPVLSPPAL